MKTEEMKLIIDHYLAGGQVPRAVLEYVLLQVSGLLDTGGKPGTDTHVLAARIVREDASNNVFPIRKTFR